MKKICIVGGCGHVGLPLGLVLADRGFDVTLLDINTNAVDLINKGIIPFQEEGAEELLKKEINKNTKELKELETSNLLKKRYAKYRQIGKYE